MHQHDDVTDSLGSQIRAARIAASLTQEALARAIDIKAGGSQISRYERDGAIAPNILARMIVLLDMPRDATWAAFGRNVMGALSSAQAEHTTPQEH